MYLHTYITICYNPSVWIIVRVSHTNYVVCVNFICEWRDLQFKIDSEWQVSLWETFHGISFRSLAWNSKPDFSSNKSTHYLLHYSDFENSEFIYSFHDNFIYTQSFCQKSAERKSAKKYCRISFWSLAWNSNPTKPIHYLLQSQHTTYYITVTSKTVRVNKIAMKKFLVLLFGLEPEPWLFV